MPVKVCNRHGRAGCASCAARARARRPERRGYSGTAAEREMREMVLATYGTACHYCHGSVDVDGSTGNPDLAFVLAHVIPHADGGPFTLENIRPAHSLCNLRAGR